MQNTGNRSKAVTKDSLSGKKKSDMLKALTVYERRSTKRNPAYLIYGFAMSFIWPLFVVLPFVFGQSSLFSDLVFPFDTRSALLCALFLGLTASCFACGFSVLPVTAFSREGDSFSMLRSMPIDYRLYFKSKRNFAMLICTLGSVLYVVIAGVVCIALGIITIGNCWVILYGAAASFLLDLIFIDWMLLKNSKRPYFNWDSETEISRKLCWINVVAFIIGFVAMLLMIASIVLSTMLSVSEGAADTGWITTIVVIVSVSVAVILSILAFAFDRFAVKKAEKNLLNLE